MIVAEWQGFKDALRVERVGDQSFRIVGFGIDRVLGWSERDVLWHAGWIASTRFSPPLKQTYVFLR